MSSVTLGLSPTNKTVNSSAQDQISSMVIPIGVWDDRQLPSTRRKMYYVDDVRALVDLKLKHSQTEALHAIMLLAFRCGYMSWHSQLQHIRVCLLYGTQEDEGAYCKVGSAYLKKGQTLEPSSFKYKTLAVLAIEADNNFGRQATNLIELVGSTMMSDVRIHRYDPPSRVLLGI